MKKIVLWIGGIVLAFLLIFALMVMLTVTNLFPMFARTSISPDFGYGSQAPAMEEYKMRNLSATSTASGWAGDADGSSTVLVEDRIVVRSARVSIVAEDVQKAVDAIRAYAEEHGGFIVNIEVEQDEGDAPSATVAFRIPAASLDATVTFIRQQGLRVASESIRGEDVTEEYVDITARLKNLEASESQLQSIMRNATKTEDVLNVHRELERVRGEIESLAGRKKYLEESAKLSSVTVSIATDEASLPVVTTEDQWRPFVVAKAAAAALLDTLKLLVNVVIWAIVFVPVWGTAILVVRYWKRRRLNVP
ncbi:MAG: DUF4349 domain-containing protein [Candidatus Peribacteraceae bacterium]|nr:DUF4349 domain-containing protein [Candidatus Peribacteraceae bacterium]